MSHITITITGPEHSGKTNTAIVLARYLESLGVNVILPVDHQRDEKLAQADLADRLKGETVQFMEMQTFR